MVFAGTAREQSRTYYLKKKIANAQNLNIKILVKIESNPYCR